MTEWLPPSDEQQTIIDHIKSNQNVIVDAVAGSGKTTTVLWLAKQNPDKVILQITYNNLLKTEVRQKVIERDLKNVEIHSFHSLAVKFYDPKAHEDTVIKNIITSNKPIRFKCKVDILCLDEVQDMTMLYYQFIRKFLLDNNIKPILLLLGDKWQSIYEFKDADTRFLTLGHDLWSNYSNGQPFHHCSLSTSYRLTNFMGQFINQVMLGQQRINTVKPINSPVIYLKCNMWSIHKHLSALILKEIKNGFTPGDFFILVPSVKAGPFKKLENELVMNNIPCFVPINDESKLDEDITKDKVIFSSFHQSKGRERKIVIIYNFDNSYFMFYDKDHPLDYCPKPIYVATTRAKNKLILLESMEYERFSFLKSSPYIWSTFDFIDYQYISTSARITPKIVHTKNNEKHKTSPTELVRFLKEEHLARLNPIVSELFSKVRDKISDIEIPNKILGKDEKWEEISDINGLVIPAYFEYSNKNVIAIKNWLDNFFKTNDSIENNFLIKNKNKLNWPPISIDDFLFMGNLYISARQNLYFKLNQIENYDWLTMETLEKCQENLKIVNPDSEFEVEIGNITSEGIAYIYDCDFGKIVIRGQIDAMEDCIWEFKCVDHLSVEHYLQVIIYYWIYRNSMEENLGKKDFKLMNIRTGEIHQLKQDNYYLIEEVIEVLLRNKYQKSTKLNDDEFLLLAKGPSISTGNEFLSQAKGPGGSKGTEFLLLAKSPSSSIEKPTKPPGYLFRDD